MESPLSLKEKKMAKKVTVISFFVNLFLSLLQIIAGLLTKSVALISDGIHSLSDLISDVVVLVAQHYGQKGPDNDHHYGHHRYETAATMIIGFLLLIVGVFMIIYSGQSLQSNEPRVILSDWALLVAFLTLLTKEILFRYMHKIGQELKSQLLLANAWHARSDAASSFIVFLALLGSFLGYGSLDLIASAIIGFLIARMGWLFAWEAIQDLTDRSADEETVLNIKNTLISTDGVKNLHDLRTRKMGDWILVDVHLEINGSITVEEGHEIAKKARLNVMKNHRVLNVMVHIDPWEEEKTTTD